MKVPEIVDYILCFRFRFHALSMVCLTALIPRAAILIATEVRRCNGRYLCIVSGAGSSTSALTSPQWKL